MDNKLKKQLIEIATNSFKQVLDIANCKDSNLAKIEAIKFYCNKSLKVINQVIAKHLGGAE